MPNYSFKDTNTNEEFIVTLKISELDEYKSKNPHLEQLIRSITIADPTRLGLKRPENGFRDVLKKVKDSHYKSNVNTW
jgi:hypothetical protein